MGKRIIIAFAIALPLDIHIIKLVLPLKTFQQDHLLLHLHD